MQAIETGLALHEQVKAWRLKGLKVAFVPTMGNLHAGHLSLVTLARKNADRVVVSIFVNPIQFGPNEDFARYPRTIDADLALLSEHEVDAIFVPSVSEMYPEGVIQTQVVAPEALTNCWEGARRPGHFNGVTTVVTKLFNLVQPDVAVFGQKDYQQFAVIQQMVADLSMSIELIRAPIERDDDGLALSSRNQYLTSTEREIAPKLFVALTDIEMAIQSGNDDFKTLCDVAKARLMKEGFDAIDYLVVVDAETLEETTGFESSVVILAVTKLGSVRLLDNILVRKS